jgi:pantoate--beta-alanine ligase
VVAKLFNIFHPTKAYFGQKDAQQAIILQRMVEDLNFDIDFIICPTVREHDGLAMSSRNAALSPDQRDGAVVLYKALKVAEERIKMGERNGTKLRELMMDVVNTEPIADLDYASVADTRTLKELDLVQNDALLSMAVFFGDIRLIDNLLIEKIESEAKP